MMTTLSDQDVQEARRLFNICDTDNSGNIEAPEIKALFKDLNQSISDKEIEQMIKQHDGDSDGKIDFEEFCELIQPFLNQETSFEDVFDEFDTDGDGYISKKELTDMLNGLGSYTQGDIDMMFLQADIDGDGKITKEEFSKFFG